MNIMTESNNNKMNFQGTNRKVSSCDRRRRRRKTLSLLSANKDTTTKIVMNKKLRREQNWFEPNKSRLKGRVEERQDHRKEQVYNVGDEREEELIKEKSRRRRVTINNLGNVIVSASAIHVSVMAHCCFLLYLLLFVDIAQVVKGLSPTTTTTRSTRAPISTRADTTYITQQPDWFASLIPSESGANATAARIDRDEWSRMKANTTNFGGVGNTQTSTSEEQLGGGRRQKRLAADQATQQAATTTNNIRWQRQQLYTLPATGPQFALEPAGSFREYSNSTGLIIPCKPLSASNTLNTQSSQKSAGGHAQQHPTTPTSVSWHVIKRQRQRQRRPLNQDHDGDEHEHEHYHQGGEEQEQEDDILVAGSSSSSSSVLEVEQVLYPEQTSAALKATDTSNGATQSKLLRFVRPDGALVIKPFSSSQYSKELHSATYKCCLRNRFGSLCSAPIRTWPVLDSHIELEVFDEFALLGNSIALKCQATPTLASKYLEFTHWLKDEKIIASNKDYTRSKKAYQHHQQDDVFSSSGGSSDWSAVQQQKKMVRTNQIAPTHVYSATATFLQQHQQHGAEFSTSTAPATFFDDQLPLLVRAKYLMLQSGELIIRNVTKSDIGSYKCRARHKLNQLVVLNSRIGAQLMVDESRTKSELRLIYPITNLAGSSSSSSVIDDHDGNVQKSLSLSSSNPNAENTSSSSSSIRTQDQMPQLIYAKENSDILFCAIIQSIPVPKFTWWFIGQQQQNQAIATSQQQLPSVLMNGTRNSHNYIVNHSTITNNNNNINNNNEYSKSTTGQQPSEAARLISTLEFPEIKQIDSCLLIQQVQLNKHLGQFVCEATNNNNNNAPASGGTASLMSANLLRVKFNLLISSSSLAAQLSATQTAPSSINDEQIHQHHHHHSPVRLNSPTESPPSFIPTAYTGTGNKATTNINTNSASVQQQIVAQYGSSIYLNCSVFGSPYDKITWFKDNKFLFSSSTNHSIQSQDSPLLTTNNNVRKNNNNNNNGTTTSNRFVDSSNVPFWMTLVQPNVILIENFQLKHRGIYQCQAGSSLVIPQTMAEQTAGGQRATATRSPHQLEVIVEGELKRDHFRSATSSIQLDVALAPPELSVKFSDQIIRIHRASNSADERSEVGGNGLQLQCGAYGLPRPRIVWFLDGYLISPRHPLGSGDTSSSSSSSSSSEVEGEMTETKIDKNSDSDDDEYMFEVAPSESLFGQMAAAAVATSEHRSAAAMIHDHGSVVVNLAAAVASSSNAAPSSIPLKPRSEIIQDNRFQITNEHFQPQQQQQHLPSVLSTLNVSGQLLSVQESGQYKCVAFNSLGLVQHASQVNVLLISNSGAGSPTSLRRPPSGRGKLQLRTYQPTNVTLISGQSATLQCPLVGYPIERVDWFHNDQRLPANHRQRIVPIVVGSGASGANNNNKQQQQQIQTAGGQLELNNVDKLADGGLYTCRPTLSAIGIPVAGKRTSNHSIESNGLENGLDVTFVANNNEQVVAIADNDDQGSDNQQGSEVQVRATAGDYEDLVGQVRAIVKVAPLIDSQSLPEIVQANEGQRTKLVCSVLQGDHPVQISWLRRVINGAASGLADSGSIESGKKSQEGEKQATTSEITTMTSTNQLAIAQTRNNLASQLHAYLAAGFELLQPQSHHHHQQQQQQQQQQDETTGISILNLEDSSMLTFKELTYADTGEYLCLASNEVSQVSRLTRVVVNVAPSWSEEPVNELSILLGERVELQCGAFGYPTPGVTWKREYLATNIPGNSNAKKSGSSEDSNQRLLLQASSSSAASSNTADSNQYTFSQVMVSYRQRVYSNGSLVIDQVEAQDRGAYMCEAGNGIGIGLSKIVRLNVNVPPWFKSSYRSSATPPSSVGLNNQQHQFAQLNQKVELKCVAYGDQPMIISWQKVVLATDATISDHAYNHDTTVDVDPYHYQLVGGRHQVLDLGLLAINIEHHHQNDHHGRSMVIEQKQLNSQAYESVLVIDNVQRNNSGSYLCVASNEFGSATTKIQLIVQEAPEAPVLLRPIRASSRKATLAFRPPYSGNSLIRKYSISFRPIASNLDLNINNNNQQELEQESNNNKLAVDQSSFNNNWQHVLLDAPASQPSPMAASTSGFTIDSSSFYASMGGSSNQFSNDSISLLNSNLLPLQQSGVDGQHLVSLNLCCLQPYTRYLVRVRAINEIGQSEMSKVVQFMTDEEAIGGPPLDVGVEATGAHSLKVRWRAPVKHLQNGLIRGYYIGYRAIVPSHAVGTHMTSGSNNAALGGNGGVSSLLMSNQQQVPSSGSKLFEVTDGEQYQYKNIQLDSGNTGSLYHPSSFMTGAPTTMNNQQQQQQDLSGYNYSSSMHHVVTASQRPQILSSYLTNLKRKTTYSIIVQAYNKIGAGPRSDQISVSTLDAAPPMSPLLRLIGATYNSAQFVWSSRRFSGSSSHQSQAKENNNHNNTTRFFNKFRVFSLDPSENRVDSGKEMEKQFNSKHEAEGEEDDEDEDDDDPQSYYTLNFKTLEWFSSSEGVTASSSSIISGSTIDKFSNQVMQRDTSSTSSLSAAAVASATVAASSSASGGDSSWQQRLIQGKQKMPFLLNNLKCGSHHLAYMTSTNSLGQSEPGEMVKFTTLGAAPLAPENARDFLQVNSSSVLLRLSSWQNAGCLIGSFVIKYKTLNQAKWTILEHQVHPTMQTVTITGNAVFTSRPLDGATSGGGSNVDVAFNQPQPTVTNIGRANSGFSDGGGSIMMMNKYQKLNDFVIRNLAMSATYRLVVEANSEAGSSLAEYEFETTNFTSSTISIRIVGISAAELLKSLSSPSSSPNLNGMLKQSPSKGSDGEPFVVGSTGGDELDFNYLEAGGTARAGQHGGQQAALKLGLGVWWLTVLFVIGSVFMAATTLVLGFRSLIRMRSAASGGGGKTTNASTTKQSSHDSLLSSMLCCSLNLSGGGHSSAASSSAGDGSHSFSSGAGTCYQLPDTYCSIGATVAGMTDHETGLGGQVMSANQLHNQFHHSQHQHHNSHHQPHRLDLALDTPTHLLRGRGSILATTISGNHVLDSSTDSNTCDISVPFRHLTPSASLSIIGSGGSNQQRQAANFYFNNSAGARTMRPTSNHHQPTNQAHSLNYAATLNNHHAMKQHSTFSSLQQQQQQQQDSESPLYGRLQQQQQQTLDGYQQQQQLVEGAMLSSGGTSGYETSNSIKVDASTVGSVFQVGNNGSVDETSNQYHQSNYMQQQQQQLTSQPTDVYQMNQMYGCVGQMAGCVGETVLESNLLENSRQQAAAIAAATYGLIGSNNFI